VEAGSVIPRGAAARTREPRTRIWLVASLLVLCAGLAASIVGSWAWNASEIRRAHGQFGAAADATADALRSTLLRYGDLAQGVGALLQSGEVSARQFDQYVTNAGYFRGQYPGVLGVGEIESVTPSQLPSFLSEVRAEGQPNYAVLPAGTRTHYCLGTYAATSGLTATLPLIGYDFCTVPVIAKALDQATVTGQQAVITGAQFGPLYKGDFALVMPLYRGSDPGSNAGGRADIRGWTLAFVVSAEMRRDALGADTSGVGFSLFAGPRLHPSERVMPSFSSPTQAALTSTSHFNAYGPWTVQMSQLREAFTPSRTAPIMLLVVGAMASLLLAMLIWLLAFSRSRALVMVRERTQELEQLALHDALTGLANRALIMDRAGQMMSRARRLGSSVSALFLDLDDFKDVNDSFGHDAGDELLRAVAERLSSAVRGDETVGRLGGDEFVVLIDDDADVSPELVAGRLHAVLATPFHLTGHPQLDIDVRASIGVAVGQRETAEELLRDADLALYEAKAQGKNRSVVFRSEMQQAAQERRRLETDLRRALQRGELSLRYQPTFDLTDCAVNGVEALLRWNHPERGLISPEVFIAVAEETGLIAPIGRFVLNEACSQAASWHAAGYPIAVAVNVSGRQLDRDDLVEDVRGALALSGLPSQFLTLEMTESVLMRDVDATAERLLTLKDLGVRLAIDDFGTGYSSLAYLQRFPVDVLKIDRSFVAHISRSSGSEALIHTLVQLGKTLHLETLAEGIENDHQLAMLRREGCSSGQGFLFARPLDRGQLDQFLLDHPIRYAIQGHAHVA
jgi:diguanylate cyclase (GGDEF)-like protein